MYVCMYVSTYLSLTESRLTKTHFGSITIHSKFVIGWLKSTFWCLKMRMSQNALIQDAFWCLTMCESQNAYFVKWKSTLWSLQMYVSRCNFGYSQLHVGWHSILNLYFKNFEFSTRRTRILMVLVMFYLVLNVNPMGRILVRWKSFKNNLEMLCHPICNWLYVNMYIHIYIYTHINSYIYIYLHMRIYIYMYMYAYIHRYICVYICIHIYVYIYMHVWINLYIFTYMYLLLCMSIFWLYVYTCMYIHIYMYIYIHKYVYI